MITELHIEGFRSLKSVTWKPGPLNVLIGPNGGGKSNLLRALDLLRISASGGLQKKVKSDGGMTAIAWNNTSLIQLRFAAQGLDAGNRNLQYDFSMDRMGRSGAYEVSDERLVSSDGLTLLSHRPTKQELPETALSRYRSDNERDPALNCQLFVRQWGIYHDIRVDQDAEIRRAVVAQSEKRVDPDGQNLVAVLHTLYSDDPKFEEFLDDAMTAASLTTTRSSVSHPPRMAAYNCVFDASALRKRTAPRISPMARFVSSCSWQFWAPRIRLRLSLSTSLKQGYIRG